MTDQNETTPEQTEEEEDISPTDEDWSRRILCSDGNCIGTIGPDGRCRECGKPYEGDLPADFDADADVSEDEPDEDTEAENTAPEETDDEIEDAPADSDDDWENRILCSDGNCIGVIGPDGRCKECGKPYEGE
jgi:hypothetical protein